MNFCKETVRFRSADGKSWISGHFYAPTQGEIRAVVQISHGMCEHIGRYEPTMIDALCGAGFAVCGNDHLGHGETETPGFFAEKDGYLLVLKDLKTMNVLARRVWPEKKLILLGHSMGSFFARWFAEVYPAALDALVISGTGGPGLLSKFGQGMASVLSAVYGGRYRSRFMVQASTGGYSNGIEGATSRSAWLCHDPEVWKLYDEDPKCGFSFTVSAYRDMLTVYNHVNTPGWAKALRKDLPIYLYSGEEDPVGDYGKGVRAVYQLLVNAGMEDVTLRLYPEGRHEMHNELCKDEVFAELLAWCDGHI